MERAALSSGADDYREGAFCRLDDARHLCAERRWVGGAYLAGRAAEAMFRSLLWLRGRQQEVGHDLRELLRRTRSLGMLTDRDETALHTAVMEVAVVWHNNLRFSGEQSFLRRLKRLKKETEELRATWWSSTSKS